MLPNQGKNYVFYHQQEIGEIAYKTKIIAILEPSTAQMGK